MTKRNTEILIRNGFLPLPQSDKDPAVDGKMLPTHLIATLMTNLTYFGYSLSEEAFRVVQYYSEEQATKWWATVEPVLKSITGDDREMDAHVVYKNFPSEVLDMSKGDYWFNQILMYWGLPNELFTQEPEARPAMEEKRKFKVLRPANDTTLSNIYVNLLESPARWTADQKKDVLYLLEGYPGATDLSVVLFKENMVSLASEMVRIGADVRLTSATDVLRLAAGMSDQDVSLKGIKFVIKNFKRPTRKFFLTALNSCSNLDEDIKRHPSKWKKLFRAIRPGDYAKKFPNVVASYNRLYNKQLPITFNSTVEQKLAADDSSVLITLQSRPGDFTRRLSVCLTKFGTEAAIAFGEVIPKLKTIQLLKLEGFLSTANMRLHRLFPPRGNWSRLQQAKAEWDLPQDAVDIVMQSIGAELSTRIGAIVPAVQLDDDTRRVKIQTNDSDLSPYGRGTSFPIPENVSFIRTASYWASPGGFGNVWYDNGWNFFDGDWKSKGAVSWDNPHFDGTGRSHGRNAKGDFAAAFSGDPTSSKTKDGKACQLIDLYIDKLLAKGVRYAVWNVLCYSNKPFSEAQEVFAALQWGEDANAGKLFEPSRAQLSFPLTGENKTKFIAYVDLEKRELVYMDANLKGQVSSAQSNTESLAEVMPAFVEYLDTLPSVHDIFKYSAPGEDGVPVLYTDEGTDLEKDQEAYVFRPENQGNDFQNFDLNKLLTI